MIYLFYKKICVFYGSDWLIGSEKGSFIESLDENGSFLYFRNYIFSIILMREEPLQPPKLSRRRKRGLTNENKTFMDVERCKRAMFLFDTGCTTKHIMRDLQIS